jgi:hypothetical protein
MHTTHNARSLAAVRIRCCMTRPESHIVLPWVSLAERMDNGAPRLFEVAAGGGGGGDGPVDRLVARAAPSPPILLLRP